MVEYLYKELKNNFGFTSFRKGQEEVISKILDGKSVSAIFPTGAGKSLCYQLPAVMLPGLTVVVSPLISLMHDQLDFLISHNVKAAALDSTLSREDYQLALQKAVTGELKVLMISVERFKNERFRSYLRKMKISLLVVDEAHCISEWGHNFRPEYLKLPGYCKEFSIPQVLLLTATATIAVADDMCKKLDIQDENCVRTGFYRDNLYLKVSPVTEEDKIPLLINRLKNSNDLPTIVYVTLQKTAFEVSNALKESGIDSEPYHAGLKNEQRASIQNRFMSGSLNCVVATIAFGMGIDKSDIRQVIHFDLPKSIENYSQEIGRAGRDGKKSVCEIFACSDGITVLENFIYGDTPTKDSIKKLMDNIDSGSGDWEIKIQSLSNEVNIRTLPLKTLLVYLEIEGLISSKYSYFANYQFKTEMTGLDILSSFDGERRTFLTELFKYTEKKKVWINVRLNDFLTNTENKRERAIGALEYLDNQNFIELSAKQAVEVYRINYTNIDINKTISKLYELFNNKESHEVARINNMLSFFQSDSCLSFRLAEYFGETPNRERCGHCSVCDGKSAIMESSLNLTELDIDEVEGTVKEFRMKAGEMATPENIAHFLCGINVPVFSKIKARSINGFGKYEKYSFNKVRDLFR